MQGYIAATRIQPFRGSTKLWIPYASAGELSSEADNLEFYEMSVRPGTGITTLTFREETTTRSKENDEKGVRRKRKMQHANLLVVAFHGIYPKRNLGAIVSFEWEGPQRHKRNERPASQFYLLLPRRNLEFD